MIYGIEIVPDCISGSFLSKEKDFDFSRYGVVGIPPLRNEPIIWNDSKAIKSSLQSSYLSLNDIHRSFMLNDKDIADYQSLLRDKVPNESLIAQAVSQNYINSKTSKTIFTVDNYTTESQQESLLKGFKSNGFTDIQLLWRPVALCLYILKNGGRDAFNKNDKITIIDFDSFLPEITTFKLKILKDELVPVRTLPEEKNPLKSFYNSNDLKQNFIAQNFKNPKIVNQLKSGPFSNEFFKYLDRGIKKDVFIRDQLRYEKLKLEDNWRELISKLKINNKGFDQVKQEISSLDEYQNGGYIFWNGFPCRLQNKELFYPDKERLIEDTNATSVGASEYGKRLLEGKPTYYDTLLGLEIFSNVQGGGHQFYTLIEEGEVEGGKPVFTPNPIKRFKLENDTKIFSSVLRFISSEKTKILKTEIPTLEANEDVPLIINAKMLPANGRAKVTIEGADGFKDVFGDLRKIELDWNSMVDYEIPDNYSGPEVYPVRGRIGDDEECRNIVREHVSNSAEMYFSYTYRNRQVKYQVLHGPWGYFDPWHQPLGEPTRAMFGAYLEEDDEIQVLSDGVSKLIYDFETNIKNRHKYLNYMFRYAPESFREELRNLYSSENPDLNWNTVYGVGRVFYKATDFELFVDFFLNKSEQYGYPAYPDGGYTDKYIWAFFRCLCYYEETNLIPLEKAEKVIKCIINFSATPGSRQRNTSKFILSAILFSLRFRTNGRAFLSAGTQLRMDVEDLIQNTLPQIDYPPAMFGEPRPDKFNDYVLRFLLEEQTKEDIEALKGLITSMT
jgi:hypothetical protein